MTLAAVVAASVTLGALAVVQVLAAAGQPVGRLVWGGQHRVLPKKLQIGSAVSVGLYAAMLLLLLSRAGALPGGETGFIRIATWVLFGYFALGCVMNAISRSRAERYVMTPATILLAVATLVIALSQ